MRRILAFLLILFCCCASAHAEIYAVNYRNGAAVVNENGEAVIPGGLYDRLYALFNDEGVHTGYAAGLETDKGLLYAALNADGTAVSTHRYSGIWQAGDGCIVCENGQYRYLSAAHVYDDFTYSEMAYAGSGRILAMRGNIYDDIADPVTILWPDGMTFSTGIRTLNGFGEFSEGLMPLYDSDTHLYGYVNTQGSWAIDPAYNYAGEFRNGLAVIAGNNGYGIIDTEGNIRLAASSVRLARSNDIFASIRSDTLRIYDSELAITCTLPLNGAQVNIIGNHIIISTADQETVMDLYGAVLFKLPAGAQISSAAEGLFIVRQGKWADRSTTLTGSDGAALSQACNTIYRLDDTRFAYGITDENGTMRYGLMTDGGAFVTEALYDSMICVTDGLYCADISGGAILLNAGGEIINTLTASDAS